MTEEKKHAKLKYPNWDIETFVAPAIGHDVFSAMPVERYARLEAEIALGIKVLEQQPKQLDPTSFQAAMIAAHMMLNGALREAKEDRDELGNLPDERRPREDILTSLSEAIKLEDFAEQSRKYLKGVEISFGPQVGLRR